FSKLERRRRADHDACDRKWSKSDCSEGPATEQRTGVARRWTACFFTVGASTGAGRHERVGNAARRKNWTCERRTSADYERAGSQARDGCLGGREENFVPADKYSARGVHR